MLSPPAAQSTTVGPHFRPCWISALLAPDERSTLAQITARLNTHRPTGRRFQQQTPARDVRQGAGFHLAQDFGAVDVQGFPAYAELSRNLHVSCAIGHQMEDLYFATAQQGDAIGHLAAFPFDFLPA